MANEVFAAGRRTDEQIETGANAVQGAAKIGKTRFPAGDLFDLLLLLKLVKERTPVVRLRIETGSFPPWICASLSILPRLRKAHFFIDSEPGFRTNP